MEQRFLEALAKDSSLSRTQLAKRLDIGVDTVKEYLKKLKDKVSNIIHMTLWK